MAADFFRPATTRNSFQLPVVGGRGSVSGESRVPGNPEAKENNDEGIGRQEVSKAVTSINDYFQKTNRTLHFSMNDKIGRVVIEIKDAETDEVIRTIPAKEVIKLAENMAEMSGFLMQERA